MKIIQNETNYEVIADINKRIIRKNNPLRFYKSLTLPLSYDINLLEEIDDTNTKIIESAPNKENYVVDYSNLNNAKELLIQYTKNQLEEFLLQNPLLYNNKFYSVTSTAQQHLDSLIAAAEDAVQFSIDFTPYWNDAAGIREPWTLSDLRILRIKIQQYILPFIMQQQQMEKKILNTNDIKALHTMKLTYQK